MKVADPTLVSTYAYVNPVVAVVLGWALAGEHLTAQDTLAATIIVFAVVIITKANARKPQKATHIKEVQPELIGLDGDGI